VLPARARRQAERLDAIDSGSWNEGGVTVSKVVLITGCSTGFGRDTVESLARAGHTVFASMRDIEGKIGRTRTRCTNSRPPKD
jgi:short subunit dehydrogenase